MRHVVGSVLMRRASRGLLVECSVNKQLSVVTNEPIPPVNHVSVEQAINSAFSPHAPINQAALFLAWARAREIAFKQLLIQHDRKNRVRVRRAFLPAS